MKYKIYLDPGHGGVDSGAVGVDKTLEKDINLKVATKLKKLLVEQDYEVLMSRDKDTKVSLSDRVIKANKWGANIYISIHCNAFNGKAMGYETYAYSDNTDDLARCIHKSIISDGLYNKDRKVKSERFYVLKHSKMRAALIELGFIDNIEDYKLLKNKTEEFANAICKGIEKYIKN